ncbi:small hydrophilic protein [Streptomyces sp. P9(2023)]|uniref:small hydrophilic protein n=1 Tax=Streptomyces sp. P9(2023) TaxID=3064394 RepID=UPI0028F42D19|nr:small hydrophilic protein [Streptomyces sp. P9(2023)]MDT9687993.1 small hydrophilic protein [Streptomyces sp. P9(2023)]
MSFTHRMATLAAVVAIPLGIAATSYALTDEPEAPRVPPAVEIGSTVAPPSGPAPSSGTATPTPPPSDAVVPGPSATGDDGDDAADEN